MSQARMFSRLQLAAALLEYDNDSDDPNATRRDAKQSAIFAHLRPGFQLRPRTSSHIPRKSVDHLGVPLPSDGDAASIAGRASVMSGRKSRASIDGLRNPFSGDVIFDGEEEEVEELAEEPELDFSNWGLEAYMGTKDSKNSKGKERMSNPDPTSSGTHPLSKNPGARRATRSRSVGEMDRLTQLEPLEQRRQSFASPLDFVDKAPPALDQLREGHREVSDLSAPSAVPFPSSSSLGPSSPPLPYTQGQPPTVDEMPLESDRPRHSRALSTATLGSMLLNEDNPFALPGPSVASRFDPKAAALAAHERNQSRASLARPGSVMSGAMTVRHERQPSNLELLRPKVLVMPSPLQPVRQPPTSNGAQPPLTQGFEHSTDGPPLPAGAKSSRLSTFSIVDSAPVASNSFTPNPRASLTLSQLTFRNTLMVAGQRDSTYGDLGIPSATTDGEQANIGEGQDLIPMQSVQGPPGRPAGRLYGKSLIDDLEVRKLEMRNKQRVFTGDQRPSMMNRAQATSTLIDPTTLQTRPVSQRMSSFGVPDSGAPLERRQSQIKPLLTFDSAPDSVPQLQPPASRHPSAVRSVFGPDKLWEREMEKLKLIEAAEEEERKKAEREEQATHERKKSKQKLGKAGQDGLSHESAMGSPLEPSPDAPPTLPVFESTLVRRPAPEDDDSDSDEEMPLRRNVNSQLQRCWSSGSSEDGIRSRPMGNPTYSQALLPARPTDSDDEDLPLAVSMSRTKVQAPAIHAADDSEEELPLSTVLRSKQSQPSLSQASRLIPGGADDDDDDDKPLGLRASMAFGPGASTGQREDEDDVPLGLHPEQQRRSQYNMLLAQQQSMMFAQHQAQLQSAMFLHPPAMPMSGHFPPPFAPPPMLPSLHDTAKLAKIDRWRQNVAVEGSE